MSIGSVSLESDTVGDIEVSIERYTDGKWIRMTLNSAAHYEIRNVRMTKDEAIELAHFLLTAAER